jgi:hypothetical protein
LGELTMNVFALSTVVLMVAGPIQFVRHDIDAFPGGYQVAVADVDRDGRPDVIALSTSADRVDWYHNPDWTRRPVARAPKNIDLAIRDVDGRLEIALASGFYFSEPDRGGEIQILRQPQNLDEPWTIHPVVHRLRWGDLDGDGRPELIHAPIFGRGSDAIRDPKPAHLWAFRPPNDGGDGDWQVWKIDETLSVLHGLYVGDLDGDGRDEILTASFDGIWLFDFDGDPPQWRKTQLSRGAAPIDDKPGTPRGSSEIVPGRLGPNRPMLAAIEPWHGNQVVVYTPEGGNVGSEGDSPIFAPRKLGQSPGRKSGQSPGGWRRQVLDDSLDEGHALVAADFDGDGADEIVAGWRGAGGGLVLFDPADAEGSRFNKLTLDTGIAVEGAVAADMNSDGVPDLVVIAGRTNNLVWYENRR